MAELVGELARGLPALVGAPGSQLFHAPIRLELALDADHAGQVANALHNWGEHNTPLEPTPQPSGDRSYAEVLAVLHHDYGGHRAEPSDPAFRQVFDTLDVTEGLLDDVARALAEAHALRPSSGLSVYADAASSSRAGAGWARPMLVAGSDDTVARDAPPSDRTAAKR